MITMTRRLMFSAAHSDWLPALSQAENEAIFGPDASPEPYGHNYVLDVTVIGFIEPKTGILVNIKEINRIVKQKIVQVLDRKYINKQIAQFETKPATLENLTQFIADQLRDQMPDTVRLSAIRLEATPTRFATWEDPSHLKARRVRLRFEGKETAAMLMTRVYEFSASHRLHSPHLSDADNRELFGKCNYDNGHGHNYEVEITVGGPVEAHTGRIIATEALDAVVNTYILDRYDHRHLNYDIPEFAGLVPSAEVITRTIWEQLEAHIPLPAHLYRVLVRETPRNIFEYFGATSGEDEDVR
jgi:6-pyruvoyltetrahydropterin/6-carboxytetrahydropterin synthase